MREGGPTDAMAAEAKRVAFAYNNRLYRHGEGEEEEEQEQAAERCVVGEGNNRAQTLSVIVAMPAHANIHAFRRLPGAYILLPPPSYY